MRVLRRVYFNGARWIVYRECPGAPIFVLHRQGAR